MIETDKKGCRELLMQRMALAIITSVTLQLLLVCCLVLFTNLSMDYGRWFEETWTTITSPWMWAYFIILIIVTILQGFVCSKNYLHPPPYYKSRFVKLYKTLTFQSLLLRALYVIIGGIIVWLHLSLKKGNYSSLTTDSNITYGIYLQEDYYFLLFSGLWSGLYFLVKTENATKKYLQFPIIAQSKFFQLRRKLYTMFPTLIISSMWSTLYYVEVKSLNFVIKLLNLSLILQLWLHQFIFILIISNTYTLFEICLTEWAPFKFGLSGAYNPDSSEMTLIDVLSMDKIPIMQHLGYLDLITLAQKEKIRRSTLFTLSTPGGHPYNWNCVVEKCTNLLKKFSSDLNMISAKSQDHSVSYSTLTARVPPVQHTKYMYHMRKLIPDVPSTSVVEADTSEAPYSGSFMQKFLKQKKEAVTAYLFSKPLISYIFAEQDENKIRYVLHNGQLVIWAAEAISSLAVFSLNEDSYGIVQKDVPIIINALLSVKQALDKLQKSTVSARKKLADDKLIREIFTSLRSAIKGSLYAIVTNFELYINDLSLEPTTVEQLQGFLNYKE
ncbi:hypothetical protein PUN28_002423 [Cardiocondyla obscurior]|uniref:Nucleoporin NDC1 n=1 Tax=Cardiocondyla obscurior TaxID=286306 RepID=A0AAW2GU27_9HYME